MVLFRYFFFVFRIRRRFWISMSTWCAVCRSEGSRWCFLSIVGRRRLSLFSWRRFVILRAIR